MSRSAMLAAFALGLALTALVPPAAVAAPGPVVRDVSRRHSNEAEAAVAVNPADPLDVVVASNTEFGYGIFVGVSHDGGQTWSRDVLGARDGFGKACCDPSITWDDRGNLFLSWLGFTSGINPDAIEVVTSTDGGNRWSELTELEPPAPDPGRSRGPAIPALRRALGQPGTVRSADGEEAHGSGFVDQPTITAGHGELWLIWNHDGWLQAAGARVHGAGDVGRFHRTQDVPHTHGCTFGDIAVGPGGEVLQVCQRDVIGSSPPISRLRTNIDRDGLGSAKGFTSGFAFATTNVSLFDPVRPQRSRTVDAEAGLAWDTTGGPHDGRVYLIFADERLGTADLNTYLMTSDDRGADWTPRSAIDTAPRAQFLPRISLDPTTGALAVGFHDASLDTGSGIYDTDGIKGDDAMYAVTFSADGGGTWAVPSFVSERPSNAADAANQVDYGDYTGLAFVGGVAHPAWADNSNSTGDNPDGALHEFDIYSAAVTGP